jgi:uncharacterized membrane protein YjgN (DUF898 family)
MHALLDDAPASLPDVAAPSLPVHHALEFHGSAREYFRIWIVNVALSLVTLGIYSAWAKVRTERYFYGNTRLAGVPFDYSAQPLPILRGRLIAAALFAAYLLTAQFAPVWNLAVVLVILLVSPFIIVSGLRFRARYSSWRGIAFRFTGGVGRAYGLFLLMPVTAAFTLLLLYPWVKGKQQEYIVGGHHYGGQAFEFKVDTGHYYAVYLVAALAFFGLMVLYFFGAMAAIGGGETPIGPAFFVVLGLMYVGYFAIFVGLRTALTNLLWNGAALGPHRFHSSLSEFMVAWIYLSNAVAIIASIGLLVPWAKVRLARYRAAHWTLVADGDLDAFVAGVRNDEGAAGAEVAEAFDIDLSI